MAAPTIPFGPTAEPLGLDVEEYEFVSQEGPQQSIENESLSMAADGAFLRWCATRGIDVWTANYIILDDTADLPDVGLYDAAAGEIGGKVWIRSVNVSNPQAGDQTLAVTFAVPTDVAEVEALYDDFYPPAP
jgi:hypothetical protein